MTVVTFPPNRPTLGRRAFVTCGVAVMCSLLPETGTVYAQPKPSRGGAVRVVRQQLREHDDAWRLLMRLRLPKVPTEPEVSLRFRLAQVVDFRPGTDPDHPHETPVEPPRIIVQEQRVDVRDVAGKVSVRARAELSLARDNGFRAGVWLLTVEDVDGPIAAPVRLTLLGVNTDSEPATPSKPDAGVDGGT